MVTGVASKRTRSASELVVRGKSYPVTDAVALLQQAPQVKGALEPPAHPAA